MRAQSRSAPCAGSSSKRRAMPSVDDEPGEIPARLEDSYRHRAIARRWPFEPSVFGLSFSLPPTPRSAGSRLTAQLRVYRFGQVSEGCSWLFVDSVAAGDRGTKLTRGPEISATGSSQSDTISETVDSNCNCRTLTTKHPGMLSPKPDEGF